jgi:hypothetical protein
MSRGRMDWTPQTAPRDSEIINELIARATQGLDSPKSPYDSEIIKELMSRGRMDWTPQRAPRDSEIINELIARATQGFDSPNSPLGLRNHQRTDSTGDARIRQPKQPLGTQKSSKH